MSCEHCKQTVKKSFENMDRVTEATPDPDALAGAVVDTGYEASR